MNRVRGLWPFLPALALAAVVAGCGGGARYEVAPVRGTVTCGGEPVPGGMIVFSPIPEDGSTEAGKGATAMIDENGNYSLSTYGQNDGAIVGRHLIQYIRPQVEEVPKGMDPEAEAEAQREREAAQKVAKMPACRVPAEQEVTVAPGDNVIDIELVRGSIGED